MRRREGAAARGIVHEDASNNKRLKVSTRMRKTLLDASCKPLELSNHPERSLTQR